MRDEPWSEDGDEPRRRPRSTLAILAIAAIPWIVVAAVVVTSDRAATSTEPAPLGSIPEDSPHDLSQGHPDPQPGPDQRADDGSAGSSDTPPLPLEDVGRSEDPGASNPADGDGATGIGTAPDPAVTDGSGGGELGAIATAVARAWLTGITPHLAVPGTTPPHPSRYAEHLVVEQVSRPDPGLAVVTLLAVVLDERDDGLAADLRRLAVPLAINDRGPQAAGEPWWLPGPALDLVELPSEPYDDPATLDAAEQALHDAGYLDVAVAAVHRTAHRPWIADVVATAPGGERLEGRVWLELEADRFRLVGLPASAPAGTGGRR